MISLFINIVILSFRVAKNYHLRQAKTGETRESWATRRVEPQGELIHPYYFQN